MKELMIQRLNIFVSDKKASKKGEFKEPAARLIQAGGGDRSNLSCAGSTSNKGAEQVDIIQKNVKNNIKNPD